jgi:hypothetical protein
MRDSAPSQFILRLVLPLLMSLVMVFLFMVP